MMTKNKVILGGVAVVALGAVFLWGNGMVGDLASKATRTRAIPTTLEMTTETMNTNAPQTSLSGTDCTQDEINKITSDVNALVGQDLVNAFRNEVYPEHPEFSRVANAEIKLIREKGFPWARKLLIEVRIKRCSKKIPPTTSEPENTDTTVNTTITNEEF